MYIRMFYSTYVLLTVCVKKLNYGAKLPINEGKASAVQWRSQAWAHLGNARLCMRNSNHSLSLVS